MVIDHNDTPELLLLASEFPPGPGGIGHHAYQLARHLSRREWAVTVIAPQPYVSAAEREAFNRRQPFDIIPLPEREAGSGGSVRRMRVIFDAVRTRPSAVLVATGHRALLTAGVIGAATRRPWLAVGHGSEFLVRSRLYTLLTRRAIESAAVVVAVSEYTAGLIRAAARPRQLVVIPNAADGERYRPGLDTAALRARWGVGDGPVLLTVGQVSERKAQDVVIRALPRILTEHPDLTYVIAGLPTMRESFAALADELGVAGRVVFAGKVPDDDLPMAYNMADIFALVSRRTAAGDVEGFGIVVQEAALCGVPAIVSRDCGLTEAIREGETGVSVPPDDPEATAAAILTLLGDEPRRREMGQRARQAALAATWSERIDEYDLILRDLLAPRPELSRP